MFAKMAMSNIEQTPEGLIYFSDVLDNLTLYFAISQEVKRTLVSENIQMDTESEDDADEGKAESKNKIFSEGSNNSISEQAKP